MREGSDALGASSDAELVARMARGDRSALALLYERHAPRLCAIARHVLGQRAEAEDLLHDVFLEVWRHADEYTEARGSVWSWLSMRTRSRALDRRRAAPRRLTVGLSSSHVEASGSAADSAMSVGTLERSWLQQALAFTSPEEREVLWLGYFEGLTSHEIAGRIGIPVGTVKSRVRSALGKLRQQLASKGGAA